MLAQHHHHCCHSQASVCLSLDFELLTDRMRSIYSIDPKGKSNMHLNHQAITKKIKEMREMEKGKQDKVKCLFGKMGYFKTIINIVNG